MTTATPIKALLLVWLCLWSLPLWAAYQELRVETNNQFGGRTIVFSNNDKGIVEGKNFYDSAGKILREERHYADEWANAHGTKELVNEYLFDIKIKEERLYAPSYAARRLILRTVNYYEQATGTLVRTENHFAKDHLGYNVIHYNLGTKTKMEWFYPENQFGYRKVVTYYADDGKTELKTESFYTEKSVEFYGCKRKLLFMKGEKKKREEWFFSEEWAQRNNGAVRKLKVYYDNPSYPIEPKVYYFNAKDQVVEPNQPYEE